MPHEGARRVFIVDDHPIVRRGFRQLFDREVDFTVCGEADNAAQALLSVTELLPDLVVTDLELGGRDGLELTKQLHQQVAEVPVLIVSMHDERLYAERALAAGARGYVMKHHGEEVILQAAREVLAGRIYVTDVIREKAEAQASPPEVPPSPIDALTDRELQVFLLLGQGFAPRHIADKLDLSVSTIEVYRGRLKDKLHLDSSPMLTRYAVRWCNDRRPQID